MSVTTRRPATVFCDLDGTLVLDNSFHVFLAMLWTHGSAGQRAGLAARLAPRLAGRLGGSHRGMKRRVLSWLAAQPRDWVGLVTEHSLGKLRGTLSAPILRALEAQRAAGARLILATAAPQIYARPLAHDLGFDTVIATPTVVDAAWCEVLGAEKARRARALIGPESGEITVMTDHPDDLPLMQIAQHVVLQASSGTVETMRRALTPDQTMTVIDPLAAEVGGGHWLWFDDGPLGPLDPYELHMTLSKHRHADLYVGGGHWRWIGPGDDAADAVLRRDCPRPPRATRRVRSVLRRRVMRDGLGVYH